MEAALTFGHLATALIGAAAVSALHEAARQLMRRTPLDPPWAEAPDHASQESRP